MPITYRSPNFGAFPFASVFADLANARLRRDQIRYDRRQKVFDQVGQGFSQGLDRYREDQIRQDEIARQNQRAEVERQFRSEEAQLDRDFRRSESQADRDFRERFYGQQNQADREARFGQSRSSTAAEIAAELEAGTQAEIARMQMDQSWQSAYQTRVQMLEKQGLEPYWTKEQQEKINRWGTALSQLRDETRYRPEEAAGIIQQIEQQMKQELPQGSRPKQISPQESFARSLVTDPETGVRGVWDGTKFMPIQQEKKEKQADDMKVRMDLISKYQGDLNDAIDAATKNIIDNPKAADDATAAATARVNRAYGPLFGQIGMPVPGQAERPMPSFYNELEGPYRSILPPQEQVPPPSPTEMFGQEAAAFLQAVPPDPAAAKAVAARLLDGLKGIDTSTLDQQTLEMAAALWDIASQ